MPTRSNIQTVISVEEQDKQQLIEFFLSKLERLQGELSSTERMLSQLGYVAHRHVEKEFQRENVVHPNGYNTNWTWVKKIAFLLKDGEKTTSEIVKCILQIEPERQPDRGKVVGSVSAVLSVKSRTERDPFLKTLNERDENLYSLNGEIGRKEYEDFL